MGKEQPKNLIVVVGNGFDIAHGLKTSYGHFADYYLEEVFMKKLQEYGNSDNYIKPDYYSKIDSSRAGQVFTPENIEYKTLSITSKNLHNHIAYCKFIGNYDKITNYIRRSPYSIKEIINNSLLGSLYSNTDKNNWFNVEKTYFELLSKAPKTSSNLPQKFNQELKHIEEELVKYLKNNIKSKSDNIIGQFLDAYLTKYENVYFVNFNYTDTLKFYTDTSSNFSDYHGRNIKVNHIHGSVKDGDIIFGYGNDQNEEYQELKKTENDAFLENFKTFKYLQNNNYKRLYTEALDVFDRYDALVLGHSLGTTDKTLLEEIFNHKECNKIMLCKRKKIAGTDIENDDGVKKEFNKLLYAMSRVIENDVRLRDKVVDFKNADTF